MPFREAILLNERIPHHCARCGEFSRNPLWREILAFPLGLLVEVIVLHQVMPTQALMPLILGLATGTMVLRYFLASPVKAELKEHHCSRCKRPNQGFRTPYATVCDECLTMEERRK
jgi:hypothetical protein